MENIDRLVQLITDRLLENLQNSPDTKKYIYLIGKEPTKNLLTSRDYLLTSNPETADYVVVDCLALDSFLRIAALCPANDRETNLITALLRGKQVFISLATFDINQYKHSAKPLLYRELLQQKSKLEKYGVQFYNDHQLLNKLSCEKAEKKELPVHSEESKKYLSKKRVLITEAKLKEMSLSEGDRFKIEKGMIVTSLAKDYLKRHHIRIVE